MQALDLLVPVRLKSYLSYTPGLSTWSSTRGLTPTLNTTDQVRVEKCLLSQLVYMVVSCAIFSAAYVCFNVCQYFLTFLIGNVECRAGNLISGPASRLDAFSAYPFQTWLPSYAPGGTTGTPEVCPSRSSRTRDSFLQVSYACDG